MGGATSMAALVHELVAVLPTGHAAAAAGAVTLRPARGAESVARSVLHTLTNVSRHSSGS